MADHEIPPGRTLPEEGPYEMAVPGQGWVLRELHPDGTHATYDVIAFTIDARGNAVPVIAEDGLGAPADDRRKATRVWLISPGDIAALRADVEEAIEILQTGTGDGWHRALEILETVAHGDGPDRAHHNLSEPKEDATDTRNRS